ncbi:bZIP transcription factor [Gracilaria domingensis]|nr:bZIP transcription factor [Gracilaria domingensis]
MPSSPSAAPADPDATVPLLVRMPDGTVEQVDMPPNAQLSSITAALHDKLSPDVRFSFANNDLDPQLTLLDTNIADAYAHANSLLHLIDSGSPDVDTKVAALDSANAVVERVSNGIKSMSALCAAAASEELPADATAETLHGQSVTPEELARSLTTRLPKLFGQEDDPLADVPPPQQPSISSIRNARRVIRDITVPKDERAIPIADDHHIGQSTNAPLLPPPQLPQKNLSSDSIVLANNEKSTWLQDVQTTWEVDTVRQSGILSTSKLGLELDDYLKSLERSVLEEERDQPQDDEAPDAAHDHAPDNECPGDSSDEEASHHVLSNGSTPISHASTQAAAPQVAPNVGVPRPLHSPAPGNTNGPSSMPQPSGFMPLIAPTVSANPNPSTASVPTLSSSMAPHGAPMSSATVPSLAMPSHSSHSKSVASSAVSAVGITSPSVTSQGSASATTIAPSKTQPSQLPPQPRQAAKIAPAPALPTSPLAANGMWGLSGMTAPVSPWMKPVAPQVPVKKKRGRKRKNPELTDEERILWRKQQNRESAKLSRVRRKVIAAEYEGKLNALINENTILRKQVDGLSNRLLYMQNLLTVSVRNASQPPS